MNKLATCPAVGASSHSRAVRAMAQCPLRSSPLKPSEVEQLDALAELLNSLDAKAWEHVPLLRKIRRHFT